MFSVVVMFEIKPGAEAVFLDLIRQNASASVRDEPGCQLFDVCTDPAQPSEVFLYELYDDPAAFEAHKTAPHYISFDSASAPLIQSKRVNTYTQVFR
jgi:autoinducer 2-degrading protein